ncbi:GtrA family protein [Pseudoxanthomonas sp. Root630]|uniref:GtrA family protein n=1 Tax=Pseudoxanthomonas sp. Root630 TaxID=1736574 RepID=UPI0007031D1F|nr:GtrA family protein [Pseudoxanthomonas sp. Root630]
MRRILAGQGVRFLIGGGANTLLSYALYWMLLPWMPYAWAYTVSYALTILSGFAINTWFVFRTSWSWVKLVAFPLIHVVNYLASLSIVWVAVEILNVPKTIAPVVATLIVLPLNFALTRKLIHRPD